ncbi:DNA-binding transcriptional activator of the SARP family [Amycolatopsis xylanica]|uniref:DNA-binding transcriptional activator of the SARP family n=1 Tax=Amycolatopsis xylanica TaxID=589385 RepID=A0A1H2S3A6_9PSEU|nr:BTAD domain-containing putative transcriptional regulator [Amycolatopsis xylanica]SDW25469.1 DNA-binding transcriptional activator of the SARP family [Amycolatopsis xylanica]
MHFHVLGPLEARSAEGAAVTLKPGKPTKLLAALLLHRGTWVSMDRLIDLIWPDQAVPPSAAGNVKSYVCGLRRALPESRIDSREGAYRVRVEPGEVDADLVTTRAAEARRALADGDAKAAAGLISTTLELWRGTPFEDLTADDNAPEVARLDEVRWELRELLAAAYRELGRSADAIGLLRAMTCDDPLREDVWTRLVSLLHEVGRRGEAIATFRRARSAIVRDLGVEPGAELLGAHRMALGV